MIAIISLLVVISVSIIVTRVATIALVHTGLSRQSARFQARSAFSGAGFTTSESEQVVGHPVRRRIVLTLMLLGNAGIVTAVSSLILGFVDGPATAAFAWKVVALIAGLAVLWTIATSRWVDRHLSRWISRALERFTDLEVRDYESLMQLSEGYRLVEMAVGDEHWLAGRSLADARVRDEGVVVLAVERADGSYLGAPNGDTIVVASDTLVLYGRGDALEALDTRRRDAEGEAEHREAVEDHEVLLEEEQEADSVSAELVADSS